jgi:aryl-alcohol dehydrogenase-like predicted oxidoreductase
MIRRSFLTTAAAGSLAAQSVQAAGEFPRREYKDGIRLSIIGFGGILVVGQQQADASKYVAAAFDRGINYYDVAPSYWEGEAEIKLGNALQPYRQRVFLACKTDKRDAAGARQELERSLKRLHTDHFDLYQFHHVTTMPEVEKILGTGGAGETFQKAKKEGKVRYLGASAHSVEAALALMDRFPLDSILFPINFVLFARENFGPQVIARAKEKGITRLALKAMAQSALADRKKPDHPKCWYTPVREPELADKALRFTLSEDITAAIPPGAEECFDLALNIAAKFRPLTAAERTQLMARAAVLAPIFRARTA